MNIPLSDKGHQAISWDDSSFFFFSESALHLVVKKNGIYAPSVVKATHFSDFAFQAEMTLIRGDGGGIVFRSRVEVAGDIGFLSVGTMQIYSAPSSNFSSTRLSRLSL